MIKIDTLHGPAFLHAPAIIRDTLSEFKHLSTIEVWRSSAPNHNAFEYRLFHASQSSPSIRIRFSGVNDGIPSQHAARKHPLLSQNASNTMTEKP